MVVPASDLVLLHVIVYELKYRVFEQIQRIDACYVEGLVSAIVGAIVGSSKRERERHMPAV